MPACRGYSKANYPDYGSILARRCEEQSVRTWVYAERCRKTRDYAILTYRKSNRTADSYTEPKSPSPRVLEGQSSSVTAAVSRADPTGFVCKTSASRRAQT